jgi:hypothetical protein
MIVVQRVSEDGLSKQEWRFDYRCGLLTYICHYVYNRSSRRAKWADEFSPMPYSNWVVKYGTDNEDLDEDAYEDYLRYNNPLTQKTRQGKCKLSGISALISNMPVCPDDVAKEAKKKFIKQLEIYYKN